MIGTYRAPGVYRQDVLPGPAVAFETGVPAFLGFVTQEPHDGQGKPIRPQTLALPTDFERLFGAPLADGYLAAAVRGFFDNGGQSCYVMALDGAAEPLIALRAGLEPLVAVEGIDLICAPDVARPRSGQTPALAEVLDLQNAVLGHCDVVGDRFAILDAMPAVGPEGVRGQRDGLVGTNGALYYPWVARTSGTWMPPSGHVAGVYASTDRRVGVHHAPANVALEGVVDLEINVTAAQQGQLNPEGINCIRAFPGRGIRVWGARTLSRTPEWAYVNVRRLFLTVGRRLERTFTAVVVEPNDARLWARIERELASYFRTLLRAGALRGSTPDQAFYIKCDGETNPPAVRNTGAVVAEIGLAPTVPGEFIVVRIVHDAAGTTISGLTEIA